MLLLSSARLYVDTAVTEPLEFSESDAEIHVIHVRSTLGSDMGVLRPTQPEA